MAVQAVKDPQRLGHCSVYSWFSTIQTYLVNVEGRNQRGKAGERNGGRPSGVTAPRISGTGRMPEGSVILSPSLSVLEGIRAGNGPMTSEV